MQKKRLDERQLAKDYKMKGWRRHEIRWLIERGEEKMDTRDTFD